MTTAKAEAAPSACRHCGLETTPGIEFCCAGCADVYALLMSRGLGHFYQLQRDHSFSPPRPIAPFIASLESPSFKVLAEQPECVRIYLEGIHCLGCLWLLEKLPEIENRILEVKLDMAHHIMEVRIHRGKIEWAEVLAWISRLGYSPRIIDETSSFLSARRRDRRSQLSRLGVAGFCTGNIMLLTVSIYAGADTFWATHFAWMSAFLAVPVLTYSAWPLYRSALLPLRRKEMSIDLAIVVAIFSGISMSAWSLLSKSAEGIYFDSLSMLVFLLLASRLFLQRMRESLADESPALAFLEEEQFKLVNKERKVSAEELNPGDVFQLVSGQTLPVDGLILSSGESYFDLSLLTGESLPVKHLQGDKVEAGSRLTSGDINFRVGTAASESRLAKILAQIRAFELHRSPSIDFADRMGKRFVPVVLGLCVLLLLLMPNAEGLQRALALAIVTCPCVLAFAIPLTLTRALQRAARRGILFRDSAKLERLAGIKHIFFDKTGTLTNGEFRLLRWDFAEGHRSEIKSACLALEQKSAHPVARAIVRNLNSIEPASVMAFRELPGRGVEGRINGAQWSITTSPTFSAPGVNRVQVNCDGILQAEILLGDSLRSESAEIVDKLRSSGYHTHLLSGDRVRNARAVAETLGIESWHGEMRPEHKAELVRAYRDTLMIGDGANDAVAFRAADVGVAMQGAVDLSLQQGDVLLTKPGLHSLPQALRLAKHTMSLVRANFGFTLAYNIAAGTLAIAGYMSPLLAALLMPLSALTVFLFTTWRTSRESFA